MKIVFQEIAIFALAMYDASLEKKGPEKKDQASGPLQLLTQKPFQLPLLYPELEKIPSLIFQILLERENVLRSQRMTALYSSIYL